MNKRSEAGAKWHARHGATLTLPEMTVELGCSVEVVCEDAQRLADLLEVNVPFTFNGVHCVAGPGGDVWKAFRPKLLPKGIGE